MLDDVVRLLTKTMKRTFTAFCENISENGGAENAGRENDGPYDRTWNVGHETGSEAANVWGSILATIAVLLCFIVAQQLRARFFKEINNHVCIVYYSVVVLKIYTLHCNVISVKTVLFLPQFHALQIGPSFSRPAFSVNPWKPKIKKELVKSDQKASSYLLLFTWKSKSGGARINPNPYHAMLRYYVWPMRILLWSTLSVFNAALTTDVGSSIVQP